MAERRMTSPGLEDDDKYWTLRLNRVALHSVNIMNKNYG